MPEDVRDKQRLSERIAEEVRVALARRRMSGRELARRLHVSPNWVSLRTSGSQPIDADDLERIAEVLELDPADLVPRRNITPRLRPSRHGLGERIVAVGGAERPARSTAKGVVSPLLGHRPGRAVTATRPLSPATP